MMPKCKDCPIRFECNQNAILVDQPMRDGKTIKVRLCPLILVIQHVLREVKSESTQEASYG